MLSKPEAKSTETTEADTAQLVRTVGVSYSSIYFVVSGIYFLLVPALMSDFTLVHVFATGALSILASVFLLRMNRWGLWLGLLLVPIHLVIAAYAFVAEFNIAASIQNVAAISFLTSLGVTMFFGSVTLLVLADQRRSFAPVSAKPLKKE